jgi:hypothetical protein
MFLGYIVLQLFCIYNLCYYFPHDIDFVYYYYYYYYNSMNQIKINPFRSYIGPRPTVWFSSSATMSEDVQHSFFLRLFACCRSLSDAFPHVVWTLANR